MKRSLKNDQSGAILLMGLFMSVLLVACLYYLIGLGDTMLFREKMQDAADASAYSAAIIHARGMNIIVMLNIIMAAVLAILVVLKLVFTICTAGIAICIGLAFWTAGASMAPVPALQIGRNSADQAYNSLKEPVFELLRGGNKLAHVVADLTPVAAFIEVENLAARVYSPPAEVAVMFPQFQSLPTEDDEFDKLCGKAGEYAGRLAMLPLTALIGENFLADMLGGAIGGLAKAFSSYFCGDGGAGGGTPPSLTYEEPKEHPPIDTAELRACQKEKDNGGSTDPTKLSPDCAAAQQQAKQAAESVDHATGKCQEPGKAICEQRKDRARSVCKPGATPDLKTWWWQERVMERHYRLVEPPNQPPLVVVEGEDVEISSSFVVEPDGSSRPPCTQSFGEEAWSEWNTDINKPVCTQGPKQPHPAFDLKNAGRTELRVRYREVTDLLSCQAVSQKTLTMTETLGAGGGKDKSPQRVKACANLGEAPFQLKVVVKGDTARLSRFEPGIRVAAWGKATDDGGAFSELAGALAQVSLAQAEYYWAGGGAPSKKSEYAKWKEEWMWNMAWKARVRRVQLAEPGGDCVGENSVNLDLLPFPQAKEQLNKLLLH